MKNCKTCKKTKSLDEMVKNKMNKDGYANTCKACKLEYDRIYRANNPEKIKKINSKSYKKNSDRHIAASKKWQKENKDRFDKLQALWREKNADKVKGYYLNNKEEKIAYAKMWKEENKEQYLTNQKKYNKKRTYNPEKQKEYKKRWKEKKNS